MKNIAVLLTVFNRKNTTIECLHNLAAQTLPKGYAVDTYIVDGGSTDGTVEAVRSEFPDVNIKVCEGVFWNRGMFRAWEWAAEKDYDYYLWLNDDTFLVSKCINTLLNESSKHNNQAIIIGPTVDTATHSVVTYGGRTKKQGLLPIDGTTYKAEHFNGNIVLVPKYVYKILGNLDYYYTHSKGDFDYGIRATKASIMMIHCGEALGECDLHPRMDRWCDPEVSLSQRWKQMHRPNGMPPKETFHMERKTSILKASFHYMTIYLRCFFPRLWI